jgi:GT2 family glycosyltransferase
VRAPPPVAVVIVSHQCRAVLERCLRSLESHPPARGVEVCVVDNASSDGGPEAVRIAHPEVSVHETGANLGFATAVNIGLRATRSPYVLVLNPDTELHAGTLDRLLEVLERRPDVGMVGCRVVRPDGRFDHAARRSFPTLAGAVGHLGRVGRGRLAPKALAQYRAPQDQAGGPVDAICGAFMLIRRAALDDVGLFDEGYWMYGEDLDLCWRFRERGWAVVYEPSASVTHVKGASGRHRRQRVAFHHAMYRFYRAHYARERHPALNALVYAGIGTRLAASLAHGALRG